MKTRELSILQKVYRDFFLSLLAKYNVDSPAKLSYDQKREFFTKIKKGWKIKKADLVKKTTKKSARKSPVFKKTQYAKIKVSRPVISIEPKEARIENPVETPITKDDVVSETILSQENHEQTDDLRIKFYPNSFFEQIQQYSYPVVRMPKEDSFLKLPRKGRSNGRGYKEQDLYKAIIASIPEIEVDIDVHMAIPFFNSPYEPDIVLIDKKLNLYIDIEIDEPYDGYYRNPTHEVEKDDIRDIFFNESGWVVIRFTERQVHLQEKQCIDYIKDVLNSIYQYRLEETSNCISEPQWNYQQAVRWQKEHYREQYLGIEKFGKQEITSEIVVKINEIDSIEDRLNRTKKYTQHILQDNIAFEDETHKYRHKKDQTGNAEYISVTTLIDKFFPFDMDRFIQVKAKNEELSEEEVEKEFKKIRNEAAEKGKIMHEEIENFLEGKEYDESSKEFSLFKKFYNQIIIPNGFQFYKAEMIVLLDKYNVAGTVDALFKKPDKEEYIIIDWKRSKKITIDGHPKKYGYGYALSELSHLDNSSYYKYALQQNLYKYILEIEGLTISSMNLIVLHENYDNYFRVDIKPMKREVEILLESINHKI